MGVLYVCDEPSVGLHPADDDRLIATLKRLRDLGNTVLVVEHDEAMMRAADWIIDLGPHAGAGGGHLVAQGDSKDIQKHPDSLTGAYLSGRKEIPVPAMRRHRQRQVHRDRRARERTTSRTSTCASRSASSSA